MPFKVCMIVMNNFRPDIRVLKEARSLASVGYEVLVLAMKTPQLDELEHLDGFTLKRIRLFFREKLKILSFLDRLEFSIKAFFDGFHFHPDAIHAHDLSALPIAWLVGKFTSAKIIYDSHEFWMGQDNKKFWRSSIGKFILRLVEGFFIRRVDVVITVNNAIAQQLVEIYHIDFPVIVMNAQPLTQLPEIDNLRPSLGVDHSKKIVIYAAGIRPGRKLEVLVEVARYLNENVLLVFMGPDRTDGYLKKYARELGVESTVRFLPPVPQADVVSYVAASDLGIISVPSISLNSYYGLGNKIFHYIAAGVPLAVSDQPERRRIVEDYDVGIVFDETDPQDIAARVNALLDNPELCEQFREHSRQAHITELNWEYEAKKLIKVYKGLI